MKPDLRIDQSVDGPQILIYHTHSQERYADSKDEKRVLSEWEII